METILSYKKLQKVTNRYKRVIGSDLEASFSEILEKWPPYKGPKTIEEKKSTSGMWSFQNLSKAISSKNCEQHYFELQKSYETLQTSYDKVMKSYENYETLRLSYKRVIKSYEKLQKVTNELSGAI